MTALRISDAAVATGIPATTLRYWEQAGLARSDRLPNGYRVFDERALERLRFITTAKRLDLPLDAIRDLLGTWDDASCGTVRRRLRPMVEQRLSDAETCLADVADLARTLRDGLARLDALPDRDAPCDPSCAFLAEAPAAVAPPVLACSLPGGDHGERLAQWRELVSSATVRRSGLAASVTVGSASVAEVAALVRDEQECCPFLGFRLDFDGPTVTLTVTAPSVDALAFVDDLVGAAG